ncbi:MAG TPA: DUF6249 domain-containing protein [Bryobacteraceae bacterium]|nr:DUF6249 domain-containing protein [Bryobacteraceae bacterium]
MTVAGFPELVVLLIFFAVALIVPALFFRYRKQILAHQERMAALEKGAPLPELPAEPAPWSPRVYLLRGLIWLFGGIGLAAFLLALSVTSQEQWQLSDKLFEAQRLRQAGGTEEQVKQLIDSHEVRKHVPEGLSLIGLVPIGVGLAYLIFYAGEKKRPA